MLYTITIDQPDDSERFRAYLDDGDGGVTVLSDAPRGAAVKAIASYERMMGTPGFPLAEPELDAPIVGPTPASIESLARWSQAIVPETDLTFHRVQAVSEHEIRRLLGRAIETGATVDIMYQGEKDNYPQEREIVPWEIKASGDLQMYLRAYCNEAGAGRTFRLDRISRVEVSDVR